MPMMTGGRRAAGYKGDVPDCVVRATAIVMGLDYDETLHMLQDMNFEWHRNTICQLPWMRNRREENEGFSPSRMSEEFRSIAWGVPTKLAHVLYQDLGFTYKRTFAKGWFISNYSDLVNYGLLPLEGSLVLVMRGHVSAVIDGVIHDTFDTRKMVVRGALLPMRTADFAIPGNDALLPLSECHRRCHPTDCRIPLVRSITKAVSIAPHTSV